MQEHHDAFVRGDPLPVEDDADWLLNFYNSFSGSASLDDVTEQALRALSRVQVGWVGGCAAGAVGEAGWD